ncbi:MAG: molybdopterin-dependent oxidoreductase [Lachnospiraceae bacterium]|jgi:xanthine dehydrogenase molybdenum-binding subunit|nr:molybdopterin-dependent oxidoreductase [Lachnospiraceae bacterium]
MGIGTSQVRVDAYEKVTGGAKYTADMEPKGTLVAKLVRSTVANGRVLGFDLKEAWAVEGVEDIVTCFDVPEHPYPTPGHPWSVEPSHQDVADRRMLNERVRIYGDDIAVVVARDEVAAKRAAGKIRVEYEEYRPLLTVAQALGRDISPWWAKEAAQSLPPGSLGTPAGEESGAARNTFVRERAPAPDCIGDDRTGWGEGDATAIHEECADNCLKHTGFRLGEGAFHDFEGMDGVAVVQKVYRTQTVQHCHIEVPVSFAYMEHDRVTVVSSTQIPHIVRRVISQALGLDMGRIRVIKPYIGGGFGNKQEVLYEPLNAFLAMRLGRPVKIELSREETLACTRVRHAMEFQLGAAATPDGRLLGRKFVAYSNQGGYASHGHALIANAAGEFKQIYRDEKVLESDSYTVYTNISTGGAMRGYGIPQGVFAGEALMDDLARKISMDPLEFRLRNCVREGYEDPHTHVMFRSYGLRRCIEVGRERFGWDEKRARYTRENADLADGAGTDKGTDAAGAGVSTGAVKTDVAAMTGVCADTAGAGAGQKRRGVGMSIFIYKTGVYPTSLETASCRMVLNQDGSVQLQMGATEIGQGADTVFTQMAAQVLGIPESKVHIISFQDTDVTPFDTGAYASRQSYVSGKALKQTGELLKEKILGYAAGMLRGESQGGPQGKSQGGSQGKSQGKSQGESQGGPQDGPQGGPQDGSQVESLGESQAEAEGAAAGGVAVPYDVLGTDGAGPGAAHAASIAAHGRHPAVSGLDIAGDFIVEKATGRRLLSVGDVAMTALYSLDESVHITAESTVHCKDNTFSSGACFAEVEVDIPLGKVKVLNLLNVHDSGTLLNPQLARAQVHGGMSMGLGFGMYEELLYDEKGRPLNDNLLDYKLPTAMDTPDLQVEFVEVEDPTGPFGNKALGEPPAIPVAPAIRNAILHATGVAFDSLPMTPQKLVEGFWKAGLTKRPQPHVQGMAG